MLIDNNLSAIETDNSELYGSEDFQVKLKHVQWYLSRNGFRRGKKSGSIRLNIDHLEWEDAYLRKITESRSKSNGKKLIEVYTDERYVHHHDRVNACNLFHPDDLPDIKSSHNVKRFCFVVAI